MHIDSYSFGLIVIDGKEYANDLLISPEGIMEGWWRTAGHEVTLLDLAKLMRQRPQILIIGTGESGACRVKQEVGDYCRAGNIRLIALPTPAAVAEYNAIPDRSRTVAALHLTC